MPIGSMLALAMAASAATPLDPFVRPSRPELRFQADCIEAGEACTFTRARFLREGGVRQVLTAIHRLDDPRYEAASANGPVSLFHWRCTRAELELAEVWQPGVESASDTSGTAIPLQPSRNVAGICVIQLPQALVDQARSSGLRHVVTRVVVRSPQVPGEASIRVVTRQGVRAMFIVEAAEGRPLGLDSPSYGARAFRGTLHGVLMEELSPTEAVDGHLIASEYADWPTFARRYREVERGLLSPHAGTWQEGDDPRVALALAMATINSTLRYGARDEDAGIFPVRGPAEVLTSGYAECKGMSLALVQLLRDQGLDASAVITSASARQPAVLLVPDFGWADHVLVHVPALDAYVDMTAPVGHQIIDRSSGLFGTLGIHTGTGDFVVIR